MQMWNDIKPRFQQEIDKAYEKTKRKINEDISKLKYLLEVAEEFKV